MNKIELIGAKELIDNFLRVFGQYMSNESLRTLGAVKETIDMALGVEEEKPAPKEEKPVKKKS